MKAIAKSFILTLSLMAIFAFGVFKVDSIIAQNFPSLPAIGPASALPAACGKTAQYFFATDTQALYVSTAAGATCVWQTAGPSAVLSTANVDTAVMGTMAGNADTVVATTPTVNVPAGAHFLVVDGQLSIAPGMNDTEIDLVCKDVKAGTNFSNQNGPFLFAAGVPSAVNGSIHCVKAVTGPITGQSVALVTTVTGTDAANPNSDATLTLNVD